VQSMCARLRSAIESRGRMLNLGSKVDMAGSQIEVNLFDGCFARVYDLFGFGPSSYVRVHDKELSIYCVI